MIFFELFYTFFKIGLFTFGGGYAMLPLIKDEVVAHGWMTLDEIVDFVAVSESTPGPFAVNCATYIGSRVGGGVENVALALLGSLCATLGVVLPSFLVILAVARFYERFKSSKAVTGVMSGLKPAVVGLIAAAILSIAGSVFIPNGLDSSVLSSPMFYMSALLTVSMTALALKKIHPIAIIAISAATGVITGFAAGV